MNGMMLSLILIISFSPNILAIRTCGSFAAYFNPDSDECFDNPDAGAQPADILRRWGCHVEEYNVTTEDGYQILIVRAHRNITHRTPIVMGHGISMNCLSFISMYNKTIAYHLCQEGYDVYFINFRGTIFSRGHSNSTRSDYSYWSFSFHQMGTHDIPTALDLIARVSGEPKSIYIGFSMGTTAMTVYTTLYPAEASERLAGLIYLAPVANVSEIRSSIKYLVPFWRLPIQPLTRYFGNGILLPRSDAIHNVCASGAIPIYICYAIKSLFLGPDYKNLDPLYRPVTNINVPDIIPFSVMEHYYQCYIARRFLQFDYGSHENLRLYGRETPPDYSIGNIRIPTAFFVSENDWIAEKHNALRTYEQIPTENQCGFIVSPNKMFGHEDPIDARFQMRDLNLAVLDKLQRMESNSC